MAFRYSDKNRVEYLSDGVTILRGLIPATLISDLRIVTDSAREIVRRRNGAQAQRLQPVWACDEIEHGPFREFLNLPALRETVLNILGAEHHPSERMAVFLEPERDAWCTAWHRDWGNVPGVDLDAFFKTAADTRMHNQLNAAVYDDHSLWIVPRSDRRLDTEAERAAFDAYPPPVPKFPDALNSVEREAASRQYALRMPGGAPLPLFAGDVAFYRACIWHLGCYVPYMRRATLHDSFLCQDDRDWQAYVRRLQQTRPKS